LQIWVTPDPTLAPPLQQPERTLDLNLFHTLPTARIRHRSTSGCSQLARNFSTEFTSHVIQKFKLLRKNDFQNSLLNFTARIRANCSAPASLFLMKGKLHVKMKYTSKVHILSYISVWFHFDTLPGSKETNMEGLRSEKLP
jgi:hypothetical protein